MSKRKHVFLAIITGVVILITPIIIDQFIIGNDFKSHMSNTEWFSFLASYTGGVLGGLCTLLGVAWTLNHYNEQSKEERDSLERPVLGMWQDNATSMNVTDRVKFEFDCVLLGNNLVYYWNFFGRDPSANRADWFYTTLIIENIGNGPAMNIEISLVVNNEIIGISNTPLSLGKGQMVKYNLCFKAYQLCPENNELLFDYSNIYGNTLFSQSVKFKTGNDGRYLRFFEAVSMQTSVKKEVIK